VESCQDPRLERLDSAQPRRRCALYWNRRRRHRHRHCVESELSPGRAGGVASRESRGGKVDSANEDAAAPCARVSLQRGAAAEEGRGLPAMQPTMPLPSPSLALRAGVEAARRSWVPCEDVDSVAAVARMISSDGVRRGRGVLTCRAVRRVAAAVAVASQRRGSHLQRPWRRFGFARRRHRSGARALLEPQPEPGLGRRARPKFLEGPAGDR